jgi:DNA-binding NarL/FixJ family response regulator
MLAVLGLRALADQAEKHRDPGTRARLFTLAEPLHEAAARSSTEGAAGEALSAWQVAERSRLEQHHDPTLWARTVQLWSAANQPYLAAYASWREAEARLDAGSDAAAIDALRAARDAAEACGAVLLRGQVELLAQWHRVELGADARPEGAGETSEALDAYGLTSRELEVLGRLAAGRTNGEIARELFISVKTASVHVSNILRKLDVSGRQEAARVAHRLGVRA